MIGILIVTHGQLGQALIDTSEIIIGAPVESIEAVSIDLDENVDKLRDKIKNRIKRLKSEEGVLILTDMFGGTPSNLSYSFLEEGRIEVLSGVNLPILIKAIALRKNKGMSDLAELIEAFGKKSISLASGILRGNKRG